MEYAANKSYENYSNDVTQLLDCFNHLLSYHDVDDEQFQLIYNLFGRCDIKQCNEIRRNHRNREIDVEMKENEASMREFCIQDIFSTVHCHIYHQYDAGYRLTQMEKSLIRGRNMENGEQSERLMSNHRFLELRRILRRRYCKLETMEIECNTKNNKFVSDLNKTMISKGTTNDDEKKDNASESTENYSYSFPFIYKKKFKNNQMHTPHGKYCDLYVAEKYQSFKEELLMNPECSLDGVYLWDGLVKTANILMTTQKAKRSTANTQNYANGYHGQPWHPIHFGYSDGDNMGINHVIALRAYCQFDKLQYKFKKTFRKINNNETLKDVIKRHRNFHHFAKYLKQAVQVFGIQYTNGMYYQKMYHGINREMIFDSTTALIYGPLSTSWAYTVAVQFSNDTGLIVELVPEPHGKYFVCNWVSPHSKEGELLFCGATGMTEFVNIINTKTGDEWIKYIKPLRLIETMMNGRYFMDNPSDIHKMYKYDEWLSEDVSKLKLAQLTRWDKQIFCYMMSHQLATNGYVDESKSIKLYPEIFDGIPYIENLMNNICNKRKHISINMTTMRTNVLQKCCKSWIGGFGGYIGYEFCSKVLTSHSYGGINLNVFNALFPNLVSIKVFELKCIVSEFLDDLYDFLKNNRGSKIRSIELHVVADFTDVMDMELKCNSVTSKFDSVGFHLCVTKDKQFKTQKLVLSKE